MPFQFILSATFHFGNVALKSGYLSASGFHPTVSHPLLQCLRPPPDSTSHSTFPAPTHYQQQTHPEAASTSHSTFPEPTNYQQQAHPHYSYSRQYLFYLMQSCYWHFDNTPYVMTTLAVMTTLRTATRNTAARAEPRATAPASCRAQSHAHSASPMPLAGPVTTLRAQPTTSIRSSLVAVAGLNLRPVKGQRGLKWPRKHQAEKI